MIFRSQTVCLPDGSTLVVKNERGGGIKMRIGRSNVEDRTSPSWTCHLEFELTTDEGLAIAEAFARIALDLSTRVKFDWTFREMEDESGH